MHEQILPILAETRTDTERIAKARDMELYEKFIGDKPDQSKLAQLISAWIERHPEYTHQALTAAAAASAKSSGAGGSSRVST